MPRIIIVGPAKSDKSVFTKEIFDLLSSKDYVPVVVDEIGEENKLAIGTNMKHIAQKHKAIQKKFGQNIAIDVIQTAKEKNKLYFAF